MGFREWLLPQSILFFNLLERLINIAKKTTALTTKAFSDWGNVKKYARTLKTYENEADTVLSEIYLALDKTFILPFDYEDISRLGSGIDDIIDSAEAAVTLSVVYGIKRPPSSASSLADILDKQVSLLQKAIGLLRKRENFSKISILLSGVHELENEADGRQAQSLAKLYASRNPVKILKEKEIYEFLEAATDKCEMAANVISDIVIKHS